MSSVETSLNNCIQSRRNEINQINENIDELEEAINNANMAIEHFTTTINNISRLQSETSIIFKGQAADTYMHHLDSYKGYCNKRINNMHSLIQNYQFQIAKLLYQKALCQRMIELLNEWLSAIRKIGVR